MHFCHNFFKINFLEQFYQKCHQCQTVWIQIRPDKISVQIWVRTVCKDYQQTALVGKELMQIYCYLPLCYSLQTERKRKRNSKSNVYKKYKCALTCDFQQYDIWTGVDSDEPVQPPFKLRNSKWCSVSSLPIIDYSSD